MNNDAKKGWILDDVFLKVLKMINFTGRSILLEILSRIINRLYNGLNKELYNCGKGFFISRTNILQAFFLFFVLLPGCVLIKLSLVAYLNQEIHSYYLL